MRKAATLFLSLTFLVGLVSAQYLADLPVTPLAFDAGALKTAFNRASDKARLVAVMSPT